MQNGQVQQAIPPFDHKCIMTSGKACCRAYKEGILGYCELKYMRMYTWVEGGLSDRMSLSDCGLLVYNAAAVARKRLASPHTIVSN
jgi:hypothetical protein